MPALRRLQKTAFRTALTCLACWLSATSAVGQEKTAWDYDPYRVLIWVVDPYNESIAAELREPLQTYLDRDYLSLWRVTIEDPKPMVRVAAMRDIESVDYDQLTAADPVLAVRKNHPDAPRIRTPEAVARYVSKVFVTPRMAETVPPRGRNIQIRPTRKQWEELLLKGVEEAGVDVGSPEAKAALRDILDSLQTTDDVDEELVTAELAPLKEDPDDVDPDDPEVVSARQRRVAGLDQLVERMKAISYRPNTDLHGVVPNFVSEGFKTLDQVIGAWSQDGTEALLVPRGLALPLENPDPKILPLEIEGLLGDVFKRYDKIFVVRLETARMPIDIQVMEIDCLMRMQGPVVRARALAKTRLIDEIGQAISRAFGPMVRIEEAATKEVEGRVRAGGLIMDSDSPAAIHEGDYLQPALRKDDREGEPIIMEPLDWAFLYVDEVDGAKLKMTLHAGRRGGLQGRLNSRTYRVGYRIRPYHANTTIRLHAQGRPDQPLQGYELHEKDLETSEFSFVGRTDWGGRFVIEKADQPLRLLYVKNGGAVLAKLPCVPGEDRVATADIRGDDLRLQAEAYIRGVQNAIIDLVALRQLLAARIRLRLQKGNVDEARELLSALRKAGTYDVLSKDMRKKREEMETDDRQQMAMINQLFDQTRTMLTKYIDEKIIRELEADVAKVAAGTPYVPPSEEDDES